MNPEFPITDEILSAFLDGELPEDERKRVEDWLESSPEARQELDDLRQIGTLVRAIPMPSVPAGFQSALMQRVEQEAGELYRRAPQAETPSVNGQVKPVATAPVAGDRLRRWIGGFVTLAAAMGIVLAVGIVIQNQNADNGGVAQQDADRANTLSDTHEVSGSGAETPPMESPREFLPEDSAPLPMSADAAFAPAPAPAPPMPRGMADTSEEPDAEPLPTGRIPLPPGRTALEELIASRGSPNLPLTPGEVGEIAVNSVVVELVCVDVSAVAETTNQLQVLLAANGIRSASDYGVQLDPSSTGIAEGDQVMIYVEADEATMATALAQMSQFKDVSNVAVNYLVENPVRDGNVGEAVYPLLNQVGEGLDLVAQAPGPESPADIVPLPPGPADGPDGVPTDPAAAPGEVASTEGGYGQPAEGELPTANGIYVNQIVGNDYTAVIQSQNSVSNRDQNSQSRNNASRIAQNSGVPLPPELQGVESQGADSQQGDAEAEGAQNGQDAPTDDALLTAPLQVIFLVRTLMPITPSPN